VKFNFPLPGRVRVVLAHDLIMAAASFALALYIRLEDQLWSFIRPGELALSAGVFTAVAAVVFWFHGMYRSVWRYASLPDLVAIVRAVTLTLLIFLPIMFMITRLESLPRSFLVINWFVLIFLLGAPRLCYRLFKDGRVQLRPREDRRIPVLLAGAGDGADLFIRAMQAPRASYRPVGILSASMGRVGREINGVRVLGPVEALTEAVERLERRGRRPHKIVLVPDAVPREAAARLIEDADRLGIPVSRLPDANALRQGASDEIELRPIEIEDLLGRPQTALDREGMAALVSGRRVVVTGAGGSIGSELVRQIARLEPSELLLIDSSEFALYTIDMEIAGTHPDLPRRTLLADVRDRPRIERLFDAARPQLVFHAAALKHVPMVESNPREGVLTNAVGTRIVADAARRAGAEVMVMVSTDKAVNPTSLMGATKRVAEQYCQALDLDPAGGTKFITVRFGNVLGSTGSVVPLFRRQLKAGGPLTVTHPDMIRYFMTIREAVELVLQASAFGAASTAWRGRIFVLDMGQPVKIVDLARQMIRLAGLQPDKDVEIVFTGIRPGEKLFEEIFHGAEAPVATDCKGVLVAETRMPDREALVALLDRIEELGRGGGDDDAIVASVRSLVPEYQPSTPDAAAAVKAS